VPLDVLILAAFAPELAALSAAFGGAPGATAHGRRIATRVAGIGLAAATAGAAAHIAELEPRAVVLVGTCGAYRSAGLSIGDVVVGRRLRLVDPAALMGASQFPEPMQITAEADAPITDAFAALAARPCCIATTLAITVDDDAAARIALGVDVDVEHLETQGVAMACASRSVPFAAVLGVANFVGGAGRSEWLAHHLRAEVAAGERVLQWIRAGAPGLPPIPPSAGGTR
jgi:nucleoside phosphorylase